MQSRRFGNFDAASRFCRAFDEQKNYFRYRNKQKEMVPSAEQCQACSGIDLAPCNTS